MGHDRARQEESYSLREEDSPPFLVGIGVGRGKEEREKEGGRRPPLLVLFGLEGEGRAAQPWPPLLSYTKAH